MFFLKSGKPFENFSNFNQNGSLNIKRKTSKTKDQTL